MHNVVKNTAFYTAQSLFPKTRPLPYGIHMEYFIREYGWVGAYKPHPYLRTSLRLHGDVEIIFKLNHKKYPIWGMASPHEAAYFYSKLS